MRILPLIAGTMSLIESRRRLLPMRLLLPCLVLSTHSTPTLALHRHRPLVHSQGLLKVHAASTAQQRGDAALLSSTGDISQQFNMVPTQKSVTSATSTAASAPPTVLKYEMLTYLYQRSPDNSVPDGFIMGFVDEGEYQDKPQMKIKLGPNFMNRLGLLGRGYPDNHAYVLMISPRYFADINAKIVDLGHYRYRNLLLWRDVFIHGLSFDLGNQCTLKQ